MARLVTATLLTIAALAILSQAHAQGGGGARDLTYGPDGVSPVQYSRNELAFTDLVVDAKSRAVTIGNVRTTVDAEVFLLRAQPDGTADLTLGPEGRLNLASPGRNTQLLGGTADSDETLAVGFTRLDVNGVFRYHAYLVRLSDSGSTDPAGGGLQAFARIGTFTQAFGVAVAPNGDYLLSVSVRASDTSPSQCGVLRLGRDGEVATGFGVAGFAAVGTPGTCRPEAIFVQPDGRIVLVITAFDEDAVLFARLTPNGLPDGSFGSGGLAAVPTAAQVGGVERAADGRLYLALSDGTVSRYSPGGAPEAGPLDVIAPLSLEDARLAALLVDDAGRFYVGVTAVRPDEEFDRQSFVARYLPTGALDTSWGAGGLAGVGYNDERRTTNRVRHLAAFPDGRLAAGATFNLDTSISTFRTTVSRLLAEGEPTQPPKKLALDLKLLSAASVPNEGGGVRFRAKVTNEDNATVSPDLWAIATQPTGRTSLVVRPRPREIPAGTSYAKRYRLAIPKDAPAGTYTLTYYVGTYPDEVIERRSFEVTKEAPMAGQPLPSGEAELIVTEDDDVPTTLSLAPNPASGRTWVDLDTPATVTVRDALGREVLRQRAEVGRLGLSLEGLAPGVYHVTAETEDGTMHTTRLTLVR